MHCAQAGKLAAGWFGLHLQKNYQNYHEDNQNDQDYQDQEEDNQGDCIVPRLGTLQLDGFVSICKRMIKMAKKIKMIGMVKMIKMAKMAKKIKIIRMVKMAKKIIEMIRMVKMIKKMVRRSQGGKLNLDVIGQVPIHSDELCDHRRC